MQNNANVLPKRNRRKYQTSYFTDQHYFSLLNYMVQLVESISHIDNPTSPVSQRKPFSMPCPSGNTSRVLVIGLRVLTSFTVWQCGSKVQTSRVVKIIIIIMRFEVFSHGFASGLC